MNYYYCPDCEAEFTEFEQTNEQYKQGQCPYCGCYRLQQIYPYHEAKQMFISSSNTIHKKGIVLIWLAAINESLPDGKKLSDKDIEILARRFDYAEKFKDD